MEGTGGEMSELKQCECGGNGGDIVVEINISNPQGFASIECKFCGKIIRGKNIRDAMNTWNGTVAK